MTPIVVILNYLRSAILLGNAHIPMVTLKVLFCPIQNQAKSQAMVLLAAAKTSGLFLAIMSLDRETSQNLELGGAIKRVTLELRRRDLSIAGTTIWLTGHIRSRRSYARQANAVDIETFGVELIASKRWETIEAIASYTFLDKDEDYGNDDIDASFYALNYANHRVTLGAIWTPCETVQVRIDNEWRSQEDNALRGSDNEALFTHIGVSVFPPQVDGLELFVAVDNAWDDDYEEVPGTPGRGDQVSIGATYRW